MGALPRMGRQAELGRCLPATAPVEAVPLARGEKER